MLGTYITHKHHNAFRNGQREGSKKFKSVAISSQAPYTHYKWIDGEGSTSIKKRRYNIGLRMLNLENMKKSEIKGAIAGILLGDGHLDKARPRISFSSKHSEYIKEKCKILDNITGVVYQTQERKKIANGKEYIWHRVSTRAHKYFEKYDWVRDGVTKKKLDLFLSDLGVALWLLDDGSLSRSKKKGTNIIKHRQFEWFVMRYSVTEILEIKSFMKSRYNISFDMKEFKKRDSESRFYLKASSTQDLQRLVVLMAPYTPTYFRYKLDLAYQSDKTWIPEYRTFLKNLPPNFFNKEEGEDVL